MTDKLAEVAPENVASKNLVQYVSPVEALKNGFKVEFYEVGVFGDTVLEFMKYPELDGKSGVVLPRFSVVDENVPKEGDVYEYFRETDIARKALGEIGAQWEEQVLEGEEKQRLILTLEAGFDLLSAGHLAFNRKDADLTQFSLVEHGNSTVVIGLIGDPKSGKTALRKVVEEREGVVTFTFDRFTKEGREVDSKGKIVPVLVPKVGDVLDDLLNVYRQGEKPDFILAELVTAPTDMELEADAFHRVIESTEGEVRMKPFAGYPVDLVNDKVIRPSIYLSQISINGLLSADFGGNYTDDFMGKLQKVVAKAKETKAEILLSLKQ